MTNMDIGYIVGQLILGISIGVIFAMVSFGLSITFGLMRVLNFAHGIFYAIGAYLTFTAISLGFSFWAAPLIIIPITVLLAIGMERGFLKFLYKEPEAISLIATAGAVYIGIDLIKLIWGVYPIPISDPIGLVLSWGPISLPAYRLVVIGVVAALLMLLVIFIRRSAVGKVIMASLDDKEGVESLGVNVERIYMLTYIIGGIYAALGGWLYAPITTVYSQMPFDIIGFAFATVVVGGLGSFVGTFVGGLLLGLSVAITAMIYSPIAGIAPYIVMFAVLMIKPQGIFGARA